MCRTSEVLKDQHDELQQQLISKRNAIYNALAQIGKSSFSNENWSVVIQDEQEYLSVTKKRLFEAVNSANIDEAARKAILETALDYAYRSNTIRITKK